LPCGVHSGPDHCAVGHDARHGAQVHHDDDLAWYRTVAARGLYACHGFWLKGTSLWSAIAVGAGSSRWVPNGSSVLRGGRLGVARWVSRGYPGYGGPAPGGSRKAAEGGWWGRGGVRGGRRRGRVVAPTRSRGAGLYARVSRAATPTEAAGSLGSATSAGRLTCRRQRRTGHWTFTAVRWVSPGRDGSRRRGRLGGGSHQAPKARSPGRPPSGSECQAGASAGAGYWTGSTPA